MAEQNNGTVGDDGEPAQQANKLPRLRSIILVTGENIGCRVNADVLRL
jgi:hypothetical protein